MKLLISLTFTTALLAAALQAQTPVPTPNIAETQVKQELNEAALAYRDGNFAEAQAHSEKALLLDPQNKTAPYFVARTIHAQYKPGNSAPENVAKARQAILAYQRILERSPGDDEAYKAVAFLYRDLKEDELWRQWLLQRAGNVSLPNNKRAEAFVVLALRDWDCSFKITELPSNKIVTVNRNKAQVRYHMPKEPVAFERAEECANRGLKMANRAITLTPKDEAAWAYKTNILLELGKLAEMSGKVQQKRELQRQYAEALKETTRVSQRSRSGP
jgi:tetratricopeptide (TPR) repeat protein